MRKILIPIACAGLLIGCTQTKDAKTEMQTTENEVPLEAQDLKILTTTKDEIRFVVGWLNETTIMYVDHHAADDRLQSFELKTGEIHTIFTSSSIISEVKIHSSVPQLLVKTAKDSTEAIIHILDHDGNALNEVSVESSELEIQWNDIDASQILITAFAEDWSYDIIRYDANDDTLVAVELADPFPGWLGTEELVYMEETDLLKESLSTGEKTVLAKDVNQFYSAGGRVLIETFDGEHIRYFVLDTVGEEMNTWLAEDDSFMMDQVVFMDENTLMMTVTNQTEMMPTSFLVEIQDGKEVKRQELSEGGSLDCKGNRCLTGYNLDTWIDVETGEAVKWLEIGPLE